MANQEVNYFSIEDYINKLAQEAGVDNINSESFFGKEKALISIVKECPFLYDQTHKAFKDVKNKEATWIAIANVFNIDKEEVLARWKSLRDLYNKNRHTNKDFIQDLSFLGPHIKSRNSFRVFKATAASDHIESDSEQNDINGEIYNDYKGFRDYSSVVNFIRLVQKHPELYSKTHPKYKDLKHSLAIWKEIAQQIGASVQGCCSYWKSLRDRFGRVRRLPETQYKTFKFFKHLTFLHQHIRRRRNFMKSESSSQMIEDYYVTNSDSGETSFKDLEPTNIEFICTEESNNEDLCEASQVDEHFGKSSPEYEMVEDHLTEDSNIKEPDSFTNSYVTELNEDDKFGQSIAAELKKIASCKKKLKLKADIYRLLYESVEDE